MDGNLGEQLAEIGRSADVALQLPECQPGEMEDYTLPAHIFAIITGNWGENTISFESNTGLAEISEQHENNRCCSLTKLHEEGEVKAAYMREGSMLGELNKQTNETQVPPTSRLTGKF